MCASKRTVDTQLCQNIFTLLMHRFAQCEHASSADKGTPWTLFDELEHVDVLRADGVKTAELPRDAHTLLRIKE